MSLVAVLDLSLTFSGKKLFHKIGFQINHGDHIGLVGPNGAGKTTLLRLLCGEISPDSGGIRIADGTRIGYLPQDIHETLSGTLLQLILGSIPGRVRLGNEITEIQLSLKNDQTKKEQEKLAARLAEIHQEIGDLDREFPTHNAEKILAGLGFKTDDFDMPVSILSGGWRMRAALAGLLFQSPDMLLLDEPTNHLDIPSIRWLERFLQDFKGAMILVCHDKDFLNRQIKRVVSFGPEGLKNYSGNYDSYLKALEEGKKVLEARARNQELKRKEAQKFIERFRAKASKARQAQSKIKLVKKMEIVKAQWKEKAIHFSFPEVTRSGRAVVDIQEISKGYNGKNLYKNVNMTVLRGERVAIIGPNGSGKTTLLKMMAGEANPDQGRLILGHGVNMSYYAQHHSEMLDPKKTILEEVYQIVPHETLSFVRGVCGAFLFPGTDVDKPIGVLSGGERARVCIAKILVKPGNLLVMDEPTNHLDLISSEVLIDALADFNGTLLFVSHNQSFINRLGTRIWDIRDGKILEYPGRLYEYYDHLAGVDYDPSFAPQQEGKEEQDHIKKSFHKDRQSKKKKRKEKAEERHLIGVTLNPIRNELGKLEDRIAGLEKKEKELEKILADSEIFRDKDKSIPLLKEYREVRTRLEELMLRWEYKHDELETAKKELGVL